MKKIAFITIVIQLFLSTLFAQDVDVITTPSGKTAISTEKIKNVVEQNSQQLKLANNIIKVYYTSAEEEFIIAKLSRFIYSISFMLIKTDGNYLTILDPNFIPKENDFELYTASGGLQETLTGTTDFLFDTECENIATAVSAINTVSSYATNQNYSVTKLIGSAASISEIQNGITNNDLIGMGNVGHGSEYGIQLDNGFLSHTWFASQDLSNEIFYFNSCDVFNDPFRSSILDDGNARTFIGGVIGLPIGTSEEVFKDFWDYTLNQGWEMDVALEQGEINNDLEGYNGIGGDEGIMNLTTSGTLRGNEIWSGIIDITGSVTVPNGVTLEINPGTTIEFSDGAKLTVNGSLNAIGSSNNRITFTNSSGTWGGIQFNSGSNGSISYANISYATQGVKFNNVGSNSITVSNSTIENNSTYGIYLYNSSPIISYNTIQKTGVMELIVITIHLPVYTTIQLADILFPVYI